MYAGSNWGNSGPPPLIVQRQVQYMVLYYVRQWHPTRKIVNWEDKARMWDSKKKQKPNLLQYTLVLCATT